MGKQARSRASIRTGLGRRVGFAALLVAWVSFAATARAEGPSPAAAGGAAEQSDVAEIGQKLSNPVADVWALFTEFDLDFFDGNVNEGGAELGGDDGIPADTPVSALRQRRQRVEAHHEAHRSGRLQHPDSQGVRRLRQRGWSGGHHAANARSAAIGKLDPRRGSRPGSFPPPPAKRWETSSGASVRPRSSATRTKS